MSELRVISWNLLRLVGARAEDVAALIRRYHPGLLLMQEATREVMTLPDMVGGNIYREPLHGRVYGLAVWSPVPLPPPWALPLPVSTMPGRVPLRVAQIVHVGGISFANVHLSHGQFLNRWQLLHLVRALEGPAAIVGDYNAIGPIPLGGLRDVGPREPTHLAAGVVSLRLDRCMVRGLTCHDARVLERGSSDHRPIMVTLGVNPEAAHHAGWHAAAEYAQLTHNQRRIDIGGRLAALVQAGSHAAPAAASTGADIRRTTSGRKRNRRRWHKLAAEIVPGLIQRGFGQSPADGPNEPSRPRRRAERSG